MHKSNGFLNVEKYTVVACVINETESIVPLLRRFNNSSKLYFCTGPEKVGKTAFSLKLLHALLAKNLISYKPVVISFDDTLNFWRKFADKDIQFLFPFKKKDEIDPEDIIDFLDEELLKKSKMIVLDGLDKCRSLRKTETFSKLISILINLVRERSTNIFCTCRNHINHFSLELSTISEVELWCLNRPEYFEKEFGETEVFIKRLI